MKSMYTHNKAKSAPRDCKTIILTNVENIVKTSL